MIKMIIVYTLKRLRHSHWLIHWNWMNFWTKQTKCKCAIEHIEHPIVTFPFNIKHLTCGHGHSSISMKANRYEKIMKRIKSLKTNVECAMKQKREEFEKSRGVVKIACMLLLRSHSWLISNKVTLLVYYTYACIFDGECYRLIVPLNLVKLNDTMINTHSYSSPYIFLYFSWIFIYL